MTHQLFPGVSVEEGLRSRSSSMRAYFAEQSMYPTRQQIEKGLNEKNSDVLRAWLSNPYISIPFERLKSILFDDKTRSARDASWLTDAIIARHDFTPDHECIEFGIRSLWSFSQRHWSQCKKFTLSESEIALICEVVSSDHMSQWIVREDFLPDEAQMETLFNREDYTQFATAFMARDNVIILDHIAALIKIKHRLDMESIIVIVNKAMIQKDMDNFDDRRMEAYRRQAIIQSIAIHDAESVTSKKRLTL